MSETPQTLEESNQSNGHILVATPPFQGHAGPLMKLSNRITKHGVKVTFLTMDSSEQSSCSESQGIRIISIRVECKEEHKLLGLICNEMPAYLEDLLNKSWGDNRISGVILDSSLASLVEIPKKMRLKTAVYWCSTPGGLALGLSIPRLVESKFIDHDGTPLKNGSIKLLQNMPEMSTTELQWYFPSNKDNQKTIFRIMQRIVHQMSNADWILCNWFHDLDPSAIGLTQNILSVGPLLTNGQSSGSCLFSEDSTCLTWLDKQSKNSVVYVAFGSTSRFSQKQLDELAMGLEQMGRPFLWVAWSGLTHGSSPTYSKEFVERVGDRGKLVEWAPQEAVLGHPSTACFITHCGWSSFLEGLSMGVPMLCWPYFGDQMYTMSCICDAWKVGMRLKADESGIVSRHEIKQRVEEILVDEIRSENALKWKRMARESINEEGSSFTNLKYLLQQMK